MATEYRMACRKCGYKWIFKETKRTKKDPTVSVQHIAGHTTYICPKCGYCGML